MAAGSELVHLRYRYSCYIACYEYDHDVCPPVRLLSVCNIGGLSSHSA